MGGFFDGVNDELFEKGNIGKLLLKFSIPAIISMLVGELYNMVDTIFVGRVIGGNAIGALVVVFPIQRIVAAISMMIAIGSSTSIARNNGKKDNKGITNVMENGLSLVFMIMIPLIVLVFLFKDNILTFLGASENILPYAHDYLSIIIFGSFFICMANVMNYMMMSLGNRKVTLISTVIGATLNIIIDYILVVELSYGVKGAAIATVVSQFTAFLFSFYSFRKMHKSHGLKFNVKYKRVIALGILSVGFSAFIVEAEDGVMLAILNNLLLNYVGDSGVVVLGVITKISMFMFITMLGISSAMQPIAAYNVGSGDHKRLKKVVKETMVFSFISCLILWLGALTFTEQLISIFIKEADIIAESAKAFRIMVSVFPMLSVYYVTIYYYQSIGKGKISFIISMLRQMVVMLPVSLILVIGFDLGALGVWLSYPIADFTCSLISMFMIRKELKILDSKLIND